MQYTLSKKLLPSCLQILLTLRLRVKASCSSSWYHFHSPTPQVMSGYYCSECCSTLNKRQSPCDTKLCKIILTYLSGRSQCMQNICFIITSQTLRRGQDPLSRILILWEWMRDYSKLRSCFISRFAFLQEMNEIAILPQSFQYMFWPSYAILRGVQWFLVASI